MDRKVVPLIYTPLVTRIFSNNLYTIAFLECLRRRNENAANENDTARRHNVFGNQIRREDNERGAAVQLLEYAVLSIGASVREIRLQFSARYQRRGLRSEKRFAHAHTISHGRIVERI